MAYITNKVKNVNGNSIAIDDGLKLKSLQLQGDTYQQTYSGKNLLKNTDVNSGDNNYWSFYSTYDATTGELTRSTTGTVEQYITHRTNGLKSGTKYTLSLLAKSNGYVKQMQLLCYNENVQGVRASQGIDLTTSYQKYTFTFTTASDVVYGANSPIRIDNEGSTTSGTTATLTIKDVMLVEGEDTDFEPYTGGPSPNPDYPQPIETVTGRQDVYVNDNVADFPYEASTQQTSGTYQGLTFEILNGHTSKISGKPNISEYRVGNRYNSTQRLFALKPNTTYHCMSTLGVDIYISVTDSTNNTYREIHLSSSNNFTFTTGATEDGVSSLRLALSTSTTYNDIVKYFVYTVNNTYEINLGKNLFDKETIGIEMGGY